MRIDIPLRVLAKKILSRSFHWSPKSVSFLLQNPFVNQSQPVSVCCHISPPYFEQKQLMGVKQNSNKVSIFA